MTTKGSNRPYATRRTARVHNGRINLLAVIPFEHLFMDRTGHLWSTARAGLRQRKFFKYKGFLMVRVSWRGHAANWLAASLTMLAFGHGWKVHWDGTAIRVRRRDLQPLLDAIDAGGARLRSAPTRPEED